MEKQTITEEMGIHKEWYDEAKNQTVETLPAFVKKLTENYHHDYGTMCHAVAAAGLGAMWAVNKSPAGGITGFQAGAILWEVIENWGSLGKGPKRIVNYQDLLDPQMEREFRTISKETAEWIKSEAKKDLTEHSEMAPAVRAHMERVAEGWIPFGLQVDDSA